ncbi:MAG: P1 family peptidase [Acidobacteriota bacterium]
MVSPRPASSVPGFFRLPSRSQARTGSTGSRLRKAAFPRIIAALVGFFFVAASSAEDPATRRARDLGIPFDGTPGEHNAITDVAGVEVGYATLIRGHGKLVVGKGPVRTGVTAIHPRGRHATAGVFAARFTMNGDGEMTGTHWIDEFGTLYGPILLTNTVSVGDVHAAAIEWMRRHRPRDMTHLPVVGETWDGGFNDLYGRHVKEKHVFAALDSASGGAIAEGNVGGGTGMTAHGFKAGTGTSSRRVGPYTVGVLVQANHGLPWRLTVAGVPVGQVLNPDTTGHFGDPPQAGSSILVIVATDAPLLPMQLERLAKRATIGVGAVGGIAERTSGEISLAFSTANAAPPTRGEVQTLEALSDDAVYTLDYLYEAVIQATEEAILNSLIAAETLEGADGVRVEAIDHDALRRILRQHGRLVDEVSQVGGG